MALNENNFQNYISAFWQRGYNYSTKERGKVGKENDSGL